MRACVCTCLFLEVLVLSSTSLYSKSAEVLELARCFNKTTTPACPVFEESMAGMHVCLQADFYEPPGRTVIANMPNRKWVYDEFHAAVFYLANAYVSPKSVVYTYDGTRVSHRNCGEVWYLHSDVLDSSTVVQLESAAVMATVCDISFYHFFVDVLPKLFQLAPFLRTDKEMRILMHSQVWSWAVDLFFPEDEFSARMVATSVLRSTIQAERLAVPLSHFCSVPIQSQIQPLRYTFFSVVLPGLLTKQFQSSELLPPTVIAIGCRENRTRELLEHDEIYRRLVQEYCSLRVLVFHGLYRAAFVESLIFYSQISILVSPHGAANTVMLFMFPGTAVIEILPFRKVSLCFEALAHACGLAYYALNSTGNHFSRTISISPELVLSTVRHVVNSTVNHTLGVQIPCEGG